MISFYKKGSYIKQKIILFLQKGSFIIDIHTFLYNLIINLIIL